MTQMEVKKEIDCCRLCFSQVTEFINIFDDSKSIPSIVEQLNKYFDDAVTESDILPKVICSECRNKIETFRKFAEDVAALRNEYIQKCSSICVKNEELKIDYESQHVELQNHAEEVCVKPLSPVLFEDDDENCESNETKYSIESPAPQDCDDDKRDDEHCDKLDDSYELLNNIKSKDIILPDYIDTLCNLCSEKSFKTFKQVLLHFREKHKPTVGYIKCCQKKFSRRDFLKEHIAWHQNPQIFRCNVCKKSLPNQRSLDRHDKMHSMKFICDMCGKTFLAKQSLIFHLNTHKKQHQKSICKICGKGYPCEEYLQLHIRRYHTSTQSDLKNHVCEFCGKIFKANAYLKKHLVKHSDEPTEPKPKIQCDVCKIWVKDNGSIRYHMLQHNSESVKCKQCDKVFPHSHALRRHTRAVHNDSMFQCHLCNKCYKRPDSLKNHIETHQNKKNYKCTYCDETFAWQSNMYVHRKKIHKVEWLTEKAEKESSKMKAN